MIKCFGVFSKVIALLWAGSLGVAVPTLWASHRRIDGCPCGARAKQVGEASIVQSVPRASRRGTAKRRELSVPAPRPERLDDHHPDYRARPDSRWVAKTVGCGEPVRCATEKPPRGRNPRCVHNGAGPQTHPTTRPPHVEFVVANRLYASLVLRQVRCRDSTTSAEQGTGASGKRSRLLVAAPASGSQSAVAPPATTDQAASTPVTVPIETLFTKLARIRLRSFGAHDENPG